MNIVPEIFKLESKKLYVSYFNINDILRRLFVSSKLLKSS